MKNDMSVPCDTGYINIRVGAIIMKNNKLLMVGNEGQTDYLYSVGGRIKFGENAEEAIIREVYEETGIKMEIDRLGFIHENYFYGDMGIKKGKLIYELSFFFYMKVPNDFSLISNSFTEEGHKEYLHWIDIDSDADIKYYPEFFRTELKHPQKELKHIITDDR